MKRLFTLLFCLAPLAFAFSQNITSVTPDSATQGQTLQVTISGQNTFFTQTSTTSWLTRGIDAILPAVNTVPSTTLLQSIYAIPSNAAVGYWDLHVSDASGTLLALDAIYIDQYVGVDQRGGAVKQSIHLGPNPASHHYNIAYALPAAAKVQITLRDLRGNLLRSIYVGRQAQGKYDFFVDVAELDVPAGTYLTCLQVDEMMFAVKTTILR